MPPRHDKLSICRERLTVMIEAPKLGDAMSIPELVGELVRRHGSINAASRKADIPLTTLFRLYNGQHKEPTLETLRKIAAALDLPLHEVVRRLEAEGDSRA